MVEKYPHLTREQIEQFSKYERPSSIPTRVVTKKPVEPQRNYYNSTNNNNIWASQRYENAMKEYRKDMEAYQKYINSGGVPTNNINNNEGLNFEYSAE